MIEKKTGGNGVKYIYKTERRKEASTDSMLGRSSWKWTEASLEQGVVAALCRLRQDGGKFTANVDFCSQALSRKEAQCKKVKCFLRQINWRSP